MKYLGKAPVHRMGVVLQLMNQKKKKKKETITKQKKLFNLQNNSIQITTKYY